MKKSTILLRAVIIITLCLSSLSCSKEGVSQNGIEGEWKSIKIERETTNYVIENNNGITNDDLVDKGIKLYETSVNYYDDWFNVLSFNKDGSGYKTYVEEPDYVEVYDMIWLKIENRLILKLTDQDGRVEEYIYTIESLTKETMVLSYTSLYKNTQYYHTKNKYTYFYNRVK